MGLRCRAQAFSGGGEWGLLSVVLCWLLSLWITGLPALQHVGSPRTMDQTRVRCIGRQILNHWSSWEVPCFILCAAASFGQRPVTWLTFPVLCPNPFLCTSLILLDHLCRCGSSSSTPNDCWDLLTFPGAWTLLASRASGAFQHILHCAGKVLPSLWSPSSPLLSPLSQSVIPFPFFHVHLKIHQLLLQWPWNTLSKPGHFWDKGSPLLIIMLGHQV